MAKKFREKLRKFNPFTRPMTLDELPKPLPANPDQRLVKVYVEGYEDVAFWRGIFDHFQNPYLRFEISVPDRGDLPKGKKVLMGMIPRSSEELLLCVDSDFGIPCHYSHFSSIFPHFAVSDLVTKINIQ